MDHDHSHHHVHNHPVENVTVTSTTAMPSHHHEHGDHSMHGIESNGGDAVNHAMHHMMEMAVSYKNKFN